VCKNCGHLDLSLDYRITTTSAAVLVAVPAVVTAPLWGPEAIAGLTTVGVSAMEGLGGATAGVLTRQLLLQPGG